MITLTLSKVHKHDKLSLTHVHASIIIFFWLIRTHFNDDFGNLSKENIFKTIQAINLSG